MNPWPEVNLAKSENRHEIKLAGPAISKKISEEGLDKNVFSLVNLNLLNISDTCLSSVPDEIKCLVNLQSLLLYGNKIDKFNENITYLTKLKVLDLSRNLLDIIPESFNNMKELASVNLSCNQIHTMPKITNMPHLLSLDVSNNKLTVFLDVEDTVLAHLTDLKLKGNMIESIPNYIAQSLPSLKNLDLSDNALKSLPGEMASLSKLKDLDMKGNKLADKRLQKLIDQCRTKQVLDYIREHCPKSNAQAPVKGKGKKSSKKQEEPKSIDNIEELTHSMTVLHVEDRTPKVTIMENEVSSVRPHILCCIVNDLNFNEDVFKRFIQMQTKLHDTVCDKRNVATIATHDLEKISPGDLVYTAKVPSKLVITPLSKLKPCTGEQLFQQLTAEAEALRKEKKRNVYSGIHKYLYLIEGKPKYPCLIDSEKNVISFPPITNCDKTKMCHATKSMFVEVTSQASLSTCKTVMNKFLQECLLLGIGDNVQDSKPGYHTLTVQQVKVVDADGNLKNVYPSRTDCIYDDPNIKVIREK